MMTITENPSSADALLGLVKDALADARNPSSFCGLVRGLEIGMSTIGDYDCRTHELISMIQSRHAALSKVDDEYHRGAAAGLRLSINFVIGLADQHSEPLRLSPSEFLENA